MQQIGDRPLAALPAVNKGRAAQGGRCRAIEVGAMALRALARVYCAPREGLFPSKHTRRARGQAKANRRNQRKGHDRRKSAAENPKTWCEKRGHLGLKSIGNLTTIGSWLADK